MLTARPTHAALGAEIIGIDLAQPLKNDVFAEIEHLLHEHEVIFFRQQRLSPEQHLAFSRRFGDLETHVRSDCCKPGYPEIFVVSNIIENGKPMGEQDAGLEWHSDSCYRKSPSRASLFYAKEVPQRDGAPLGDTMFASVTAAYDALSDEMKARLVGLRVCNSRLQGYTRPRKRGARPPLTEPQKNKIPDVEHPLVRIHPFTGKKCLFLNRSYTARILGVGKEESDTLLEELIEHYQQPRFVYRHQWQVGDFLIWDNCATQHCAIADYELPQRRLMERTTIVGTPSI